MAFHVYSMIFPKALLNIAFVILADNLLEYLSVFDREMKLWHVMRLESYELSKTVPLTSVKSLPTYSPSLLRHPYPTAFNPLLPLPQSYFRLP